MSVFSFSEMRNLYASGMLKDHLDCKQYILKFIQPLTNGTYALIENDQVTMIQKETMNEVYFAKFKPDIKKWFNKETDPKQIICDITKPTVGDNYINISKTLKHKYVKYDEYSQEIKDAVNLMLSYIKEV